MRFEAILSRSWALLGCSWPLLGGFWPLLGRSWLLLVSPYSPSGIVQVLGKAVTFRKSRNICYACGMAEQRALGEPSVFVEIAIANCSHESSITYILARRKLTKKRLQLLSINFSVTHVLKARYQTGQLNLREEINTRQCIIKAGNTGL